jgi:hypothetical protein
VAKGRHEAGLPGAKHEVMAATLAGWLLGRAQRQLYGTVETEAAEQAEAAAGRIQAVRRGERARRQLRTEREAATRVQAMHRGNLARNHRPEMSPEEMEQAAAAARIQAARRGKLSRRHMQEERDLHRVRDAGLPPPSLHARSPQTRESEMTCDVAHDRFRARNGRAAREARATAKAK